MRHIFLFSLLAVSVCESFGQRIQGVYVGKILSDRNAFALTAKGDQVTGDIYINEKEHFKFTGTYIKPMLKGVIHLDSLKKDSIEANLVGNSLKVTFPNSLEARLFSVYKVSTKSSIDMSDLFSEKFDMLLLGEWKMFKREDISGHDITDASMVYGYQLHGTGKVELSDMPSTAKVDLSWETQAGVLNYRIRMSFPASNRESSFQYNDHYSIRNDTLVIRNKTNNNLTYWKRK